jgi:hypothetical protein
LEGALDLLSAISGPGLRAGVASQPDRRGQKKRGAWGLPSVLRVAQAGACAGLH